MKKILIVDDENSIRDLVGMILEDSFEVISAKDGEDAMAIIESQKIDAVITDVMMPKKDGLSLIREINEKFPEIICYIISANNHTIDKNIKVSNVFLKPFDIEELKTKIDQIK